MRALRPALRLALVLVALVIVALPHLLQAQAVPVTGVFPVDLPSAGCHTESFDPYALFSYPGRGFLVTLDWSGENCTSLPPEVGVGFIFSEDGEPDGTFFLSPPRSQPYSLVDYPVAIPGGNGGFTPVFGQVWQALRDADSCVRRGGQFLCDTAGDGGAPEEAMAFGSGDPREIPFLADWDGDGRTDPCLYRGRQFFCDTAHDGGLAEARTLDVGLPGDVPLLGDLDGDGRADPCVRRGVAFLCDRARDGGSKDLKIPFGLRSDLPLLGDPDGDGRDDPCVYRGGLFLCDTGHDGIAAELRLDLGSALSASALQAPLLGDVDGDGRDEACLWSSGHLICGVFGPRGGRPLRLLERAFGTRGDIPLLGDLDAF